MSHPIYLTKMSKLELGLVGIVLIASLIGALIGLINFTSTPDVVAEHAVEQKTTVSGMASVSYVDENNNYFVSDGKEIWDVKMAKGDNGWAVQNITKSGSVQEMQAAEQQNAQ